MTYVLGLTGGIASGKSTVSQILADYGAKIIDGDVVARELQNPGEKGLTAIVKQFGEKYLNSNGTLNRGLLGELVFNDSNQLAKLNQIMSPLIKAQILSELKKYQEQQTELVVIDIALLFEGNYQKYCTSTLMIQTTPERQLHFLMTRNHLSVSQAHARIDSQMSSAARAKLADEVIQNDGSVEELKQKMIKWLTSKHLFGNEVD